MRPTALASASKAWFWAGSGVGEMQGLDGNLTLQLGIETQIDNALRPNSLLSSKRPILSFFAVFNPDQMRHTIGTAADDCILPVILSRCTASSGARSGTKQLSSTGAWATSGRFCAM